MDEIRKDRRFRHVFQDPMFRPVPRSIHKSKLDDRFKSVLSDDSFRSYPSNKDARGAKRLKSEIDNLDRYYDFDAHKATKNTVDSNRKKEKKGRLKRKNRQKSSPGEIALEQEESVVRNEGAYQRLAICGMDWDFITAKDLFVALASVVEDDGCLESVKIYPSQFGLKEMEKEKSSGPNIKVSTGSLKDDFDQYRIIDETEAEKAETEALMTYQLKRLRYYYAIATVDSVATAKKIYEELDGQEYENSGNRFDLRYVSDDISFDSEPKDECIHFPGEDYKPTEYSTKALFQTRVDCTWDETPKERQLMLNRRYDNPEEALQAYDEIAKKYIASSEDGDDGLLLDVRDNCGDEKDDVEVEWDDDEPSEPKNKPKGHRMKMKQKAYEKYHKRKMTKDKAVDPDEEVAKITGDSRFTEMFKVSNYHIDPTSTLYKETEVMKRLISRPMSDDGV